MAPQPAAAPAKEETTPSTSTPDAPAKASTSTSAEPVPVLAPSLPQAPATDAELIAMVVKYNCFVFDCDGCIWHGNTLVPGADEVLALLRKHGKYIAFATNNATHSRQTLLKKIKSFGITAYEEEVLGSAYAAAAYLKRRRFTKKAYVIGEKGLVEELENFGIKTVGGPTHAGVAVDWDAKPSPRMDVDKEIGAVVVGLDRAVSYYKVQYALTCLLENPGCLFIATNTDARGNFTVDQEWCGAGTMVGALIGASEREPVVVGKPTPFLLECVCRASGVPREQVCIVGDRLDTDILWGNRNGCGTLLVMTGVTSEALLRSPENAIFPTSYAPSVADLLRVKDKLAAALAANATCAIQ